MFSRTDRGREIRFANLRLAIAASKSCSLLALAVWICVSRPHLLNNPMISALASVLKCKLKPTTAADVSAFTSSLSVFTANTVNRVRMIALGRTRPAVAGHAEIGACLQCACRQLAARAASALGKFAHIGGNIY
jgi:hypothetical protein